MEFWKTSGSQEKEDKSGEETNRKHLYAPTPDLIHDAPKLYQMEIVQIQKLTEADRGDKYTPNYMLYIRASL